MWLHLAAACGSSSLGAPGTAVSDPTGAEDPGPATTAAPSTPGTTPPNGSSTPPPATGASTGHTGDTGAATGTGGGTGAEDPLPQWFCSEPGASMAFTPANPTVGGAVDVSVTAPVGYVYIGMTPSPPSGWTELAYTVSGSGPFTWTWTYAIDRADRFDFAFSADNGTLAVCAGSVWTASP